MDKRWAEKLAGELKKRDNETKLGNIVGEVVNTNPLTISVLGGSGLFSGDSINVNSNLLGYDEDVTITINGETHNAVIHHEGLSTGDKVHVAFTEDGQSLFVTSKL